MEIFCTRPKCPRPLNTFTDLDDPPTLKTISQKYCTSCGMPLILGARYLTMRLLGQGGFGAAFLAKDRYTPTQRLCVVKQFQPSGDLSPQALEIAHQLFEREAEVLEQLGRRHEQIPDLYAFFPLIVPKTGSNQSDQFFYLVQEFIDGQTLEEELIQKKSFSETEVKAILENLLNVLAFVHDNGSIHRDIKPSNIMRDSKGQLYLLDFGAVKQVTGGMQGSSTGIYTAGYAPPEQMKGSQVYPSSDLYALAATCVHFLTGKPVEDLYDSYSNTWKWKASVPKISDRLTAILERMLLPAPQDRFESAADVLEALHQPNIPAPPSPQTLVQQPTAPPPVSVAPSGRFSLPEILGSAAFTGFEGSLLAIALKSFLPTVADGIIVAVVVGLMAGLVFILNRRLLEGKDLPVFAVISLLLIMFVPPLHRGLSSGIFGFSTLISIAFIAIVSALVAVAITTFFRLIYQLFSLLFSR